MPCERAGAVMTVSEANWSQKVDERHPERIPIRSTHSLRGEGNSDIPSCWPTQDRADSSRQGRNCPFRGLARQCLEFAEDPENTKANKLPRHPRADRFRRAGDWKVVHDDDV